MANVDVEECPVCLEEFNHLKLLECGHSFCVSCIEKSSSTGDDGFVSILCPNDQTETLLPDGKANNLRTKFMVNLACESCYMNKSINESWWCDTCCSTSCGNCAMKKHKSHACKEWNEFVVVKECYALCKSKCVSDDINFTEARNSIYEFCIQMEEKLLNYIDEQERSRQAVVNMKNAFGVVDDLEYRDEYVIDHMTKKLNIISKLHQAVGIPDLPQILNSSRARHTLQLPMIEEVLALCLKMKNCSITPKEQKRIKYNRFIDGLRHVSKRKQNFVLILFSLLMLWKAWIVFRLFVPMVIVHDDSMEPTLHQGDLLFLTYNNLDPIRVGEIVVCRIDGRNTALISRVMKMHERENGTVKFLTKRDNKETDDWYLLPHGQHWLERKHLVGRVRGYIPYIGLIMFN